MRSESTVFLGQPRVMRLIVGIGYFRSEGLTAIALPPK